MAEKPLNMKDSLAVIEEIEGKLEKILSKRKEEIERELDEKLRAIKEEAEKKIESIEKELEKGKQILHDYRTVIGEFESERNAIQRQIREHFEKAIQHQTEIERMAGLTLEELRIIGELNRKLETIHQTAEEKVSLYRKDLEERFGIAAELPESVEEEEVKIDLEQELLKLKKIKELLETGPVEVEKAPAEEAAEMAAEAPVEAEAPAPAIEEGVPPGFPEINEVMEGALAREAEAERAAEEEVQPAERVWEEDRESFQRLFETLEKYRKIESRNGNGEVSFFQNDEKLILDGEHIVASIDESMEEAKRLYLKLSQTESPKEQFFIKQEIINYQEMLRKFLLRYIKMSEKEGASLPQFTTDILNLEILKDILEKLSMENWSNPADFNSFRLHAESLKDSYYAKITPPSMYLRSLIEELEG
ncbi:MAG: hypothetical protein QHH14_06075 [Clostridiales bacterium]|nr:hypothetical protein [Clostridiales bacterium]